MQQQLHLAGSRAQKAVQIHLPSFVVDELKENGPEAQLFIYQRGTEVVLELNGRALVFQEFKKEKTAHVMLQKSDTSLQQVAVVENMYKFKKGASGMTKQKTEASVPTKRTVLWEEEAEKEVEEERDEGQKAKQNDGHSNPTVEERERERERDSRSLAGNALGGNVVPETAGATESGIKRARTARRPITRSNDTCSCGRSWQFHLCLWLALHPSTQGELQQRALGCSSLTEAQAGQLLSTQLPRIASQSSENGLWFLSSSCPVSYVDLGEWMLADRRESCSVTRQERRFWRSHVTSALSWQTLLQNASHPGGEHDAVPTDEDERAVEMKVEERVQRVAQSYWKARQKEELSQREPMEPQDAMQWWLNSGKQMVACLQRAKDNEN